tara:strand:+ start:549 stop:707 length:159 start_codon:yes stop_codon:yes gene_type:complete
MGLFFYLSFDNRIDEILLPSADPKHFLVTSDMSLPMSFFEDNPVLEITESII